MSAAKKNAADKAYTANYPELERWLQHHEARCNWQILRGKESGHHAYVESWSIGHREFLIVVRSHRHGWDIFTSGGEAEIRLTLDDAGKRLHLHDHVDTALESRCEGSKGE